MIWKKKTNKELVITYRIASGIPFRWEYKIKNPKIVECSKTKTRSTTRKKNLCGAPFDTDYYFKGLKEGKTEIIFELYNISEDTKEEKDFYKVEVDKDLNIHLIEGEE